jgi:hypothetical protein
MMENDARCCLGDFTMYNWVGCSACCTIETGAFLVGIIMKRICWQYKYTTKAEVTIYSTRKINENRRKSVVEYAGLRGGVPLI